MNVLEEAQDLTSGDRNRDYGHPLDNHNCTAALWSTFLTRKYGAPMTLDAEDVCWLNVLQKISREANATKRDTWVDVCGYTRNVEMIAEERVRRRSGE